MKLIGLLFGARFGSATVQRQCISRARPSRVPVCTRFVMVFYAIAYRG